LTSMTRRGQSPEGDWPNRPHRGAFQDLIPPTATGGILQPPRPLAGRREHGRQAARSERSRTAGQASQMPNSLTSAPPRAACLKPIRGRSGNMQHRCSRAVYAEPKSSTGGLPRGASSRSIMLSRPFPDYILMTARTPTATHSRQAPQMNTVAEN
jgi:hypothetical protein